MERGKASNKKKIKQRQYTIYDGLFYLHGIKNVERLISLANLYWLFGDKWA